MSGSGWPRRSSAAGMKVAIADVREDHLEEATAELGGAVHAIRLDVTDREAFARAADETERVLGKVHVLCNNAGINLFNDIAEATYQDWDWVLGRQPRRRRQRRRHVRAQDQGARRARARRQHGVDGRIRRRPGRRHLHDGKVRECTGCRTRCAGACCHTGSASRWSARASSRARSTRATASGRPELSTDATPADEEFMRILPGIHDAGM